MCTPDNVVEAAAKALWGAMPYEDAAWEDLPDDLLTVRNLRRQARIALQAAAPFIAAQALRDAADNYRTEWWGSKESVAIKSVRLGFAVTLNRRADEIERGDTTTNS